MSARGELINATDSDTTVDAARPDATVHSAAQRRWILIGVCVALMAVISSVTGLNVAQREIALDLDASQSDVLCVKLAVTTSSSR